MQTTAQIFFNVFLFMPLFYIKMDFKETQVIHRRSDIPTERSKWRNPFDNP